VVLLGEAHRAPLLISSRWLGRVAVLVGT